MEYSDIPINELELEDINNRNVKCNYYIINNILSRKYVKK